MALVTRVLAHRVAHVVQSQDHASLARHRIYALSVRAESAQATAGTVAVVRQQVQLVISAKVIPHPAKAHYGGEDAHFVSDIDGGALGVADGVGGWNDSGISPAEYSRTFMETARKFLEGEIAEPSSAAATSEWMDARATPNGMTATSTDCEGDAAAFELADNAVAERMWAKQTQQDVAAANGTVKEAVNGAAKEAEQQQQQWRRGDPSRTPLKALDVAHKLTRLPGSATACILRLDRERGVLNAANLGDSGFLLVRQGELFFQSPALQHFFDCPYQFGACPEYAEATDYAEDAEVYDFEVQPGDVIVLGSDGLLDNCYTNEIVRLAPKSADKVAEAAAAMAELASNHSADKEFESPYTQEAAQEGFDIPIWEKLAKASFQNGKLQLGKLRGGKMDDITVLVAYVETVGSNGGSAAVLNGNGSAVNGAVSK